MDIRRKYIFSFTKAGKNFFLKIYTYDLQMLKMTRQKDKGWSTMTFILIK